MEKLQKRMFPLLCIFSLFATYFSKIDTQFKVLPIACIYILLFRYYRGYGSLFRLRGWCKIVFNFYVFYCIFLILRSIFYDSNSGLIGSYFLSLFGNLEFGILSWILPITVMVVYEDGIIQSYRKVCDILVVTGILLGLLYLGNVDSSSFNKFFYLIPVVCPRLLLCRRKQYLYWIYFTISFLYCYVEDERSILGMNVLCIVGLATFMFFKKRKRVIKLIKLYSCIVPVVGVFLTTVNLVTGDSIFTMMEDTYGNKSSMVQDSRTFLFRELNEDLTKTSSWIYGKGIFGTYYSQVMHDAQISKSYSDNENRLGTECGHLWLLLKGGIFYYIIYVLLFYIAILRGNKSDNIFLVFLAFVMASRLLLMFVSFTPSFDISNIIIWLFLALCIQQFPIQFIKNNEK